MSICAGALLLVSLWGGPPAGDELFTEGDRVVFVGDTLIERAQEFGFLETALICRHPQKRMVFRNVGWSGDTTTGLSRIYFDSPAEGKKRLLEQIGSNKPSVLVFGFGMAESFAGEAGLQTFKNNYNLLLSETTEQTRTILLSPIRQERPRPALPDPTQRNRQLALYTQAISELAAERNARYVDLFSSGELSASKRPLTENGIHLTEAGYWLWAMEILHSLDLPAPSISVTVGLDKKVTAEGTQVSDLTADGNSIAFTQTDSLLPTVVPAELPAEWLGHSQCTKLRLAVRGLKPGKYTLRGDGDAWVTADAGKWNDGVTLTNSPQHQRAERLRELVRQKNSFYFQQYRPQNITYLLGFRRYEQGQNAEELQKLNEYIQQAEDEIAGLKKPVPVRFELVPAS